MKLEQQVCTLEQAAVEQLDAVLTELKNMK